MAEALCDLQLELQSQPPTRVALLEQRVHGASKNPQTDTVNFIPSTPAAKDYKRNHGVSNASTNSANKFDELKADLPNSNLRMNRAELRINSLNPSLDVDGAEGNSSGKPTCPESSALYNVDPCNPSGEPGVQTRQIIELSERYIMFNFPSPSELANLDEKFLAKRCNLGYRARRIIKLAKGIVEGRIPMRELEEVCKGASLSKYDEMEDHLKVIEGFGPFTCANVLMCMGFYHVIPTDSETMRHLKQVHSRNSIPKTVQRDVQEIYGKYAPFQFLAYWEEIWHFYEQTFGKLSEMPRSDYKRITASNMRSKASLKGKRRRIS